MSKGTGVKVRAFDLDGNDLGEVHVPLPILVGDILAFDTGPPQEIVAVEHGDGRPVKVTVRPVKFRTDR